MKYQQGPQKYVVQFFHDDAGRMVRKRVVDNTVQDTINTRYETEWEYDGMGRIVRERTLQYDATSDMMVTLRNEHKTYDLGGNVTEIKFYDVDGYAYTLTQTFAQGYQITDFSVSADSSVTSSTSGSFTYDTNNNILTTKEFNATRTSSGKQLEYRGLWTFTYDRANRLKSYTNSNSGGSRGNVWYDSRGKVWQRWNDQVIGGAWDESLKRYVYDGGQLVQEHLWDVAEDQGSWVYSYNDIDRDYLRHQGGIRQREGTATAYNDFYLQKSGAAIEIKTQRDQASATIARAERTQSLNQMAGTTFTDISNLATSNSPIAMYGGGTSGGTGGFDGLVQKGHRYYLAGITTTVNDDPSRLLINTVIRDFSLTFGSISN